VNVFKSNIRSRSLRIILGSAHTISVSCDMINKVIKIIGNPSQKMMGARKVVLIIAVYCYKMQCDVGTI